MRDVWAGKLLAFEVKQEDSSAGLELDGTPTLELIDRIRAMRDDSIQAAAEKERAIRESVGVCPKCGG